MIDRADHGRVGRIDLDHFDARPVADAADRGKGLLIGEGGPQLRLLRVGGLRVPLLLVEVQALDHDRLASARGLAGDGLGECADF